LSGSAVAGTPNGAGPCVVAALRTAIVELRDSLTEYEPTLPSTQSAAHSPCASGGHLILSALSSAHRRRRRNASPCPSGATDHGCGMDLRC
jgi:hypothetical protein